MRTPKELREAAHTCIECAADEYNHRLASKERAELNLAADVLTEKADAMEKGEQGFIAYMRTRRCLANYIVGENLIDYDETVTNAADAYQAGRTDGIASMQAQLNAVNARGVKLENWRARASGIEKQAAYSHYKVFGDRNYAYSGPHESIDLLVAECITCAKERDKAQAALSTARADCVTLANEIKRMDDLLVNLHSNPTMYTHQAIAACAAIDDGRSPAVVEAMERAKEAKYDT